MHGARGWCFIAVFMLSLVPTVAARAVERSQVPDNLKWNLADLFASEQAWTQAKDQVAADIPDLSRFQGHLGDSPQALLKGLEAVMDVSQRLQRVGSYAHQRYDEDTRVGHSMEMRQAAEQISVKFQTAVSFLKPEIIALGKEKVEAFLKAEPKLEPYRPYLVDLLRWGPHALDPAREKIVAQAGNLTDTGYDIHSIFTGAEMPFPTVVLADGDSVRLDDAAYSRYRASLNRADRVKVFHAFWKAYQHYRRTLGTALYAQVKSHVFDRDVHNFDSCLQAALFRDAIPTRVYTQLIADVHENLPTLHRYLKLRKRMLGLKELGYEDLYAPLVKKVNMEYTPEEAKKLVMKAVAPLGSEYVQVLGKGLDQGWVDWMPSTGKRSGAYSTMVYGVHPYELLNFGGTYDDVSTLAHESGHSMHSYLSGEHQPFVTHDYSIFVAEVASTCNENLLFHSMLDDAKDDDTRLFLLGNYLEGLRTTLFRQVLFAEFELKIHEMAENGQPLTGDNMNELYLSLLKQYYGDAEGVCHIDDLYAVEWAFVPHFYYDFYVYQYATSIVASTAIADGIRAERAATPPSTQRRDSYLHMLSSGSSKEPIDLLKGAGVDMTTSAPFQAAMAEMNEVMDQIEAILDKR